MNLKRFVQIGTASLLLTGCQIAVDHGRDVGNAGQGGSNIAGLAGSLATVFDNIDRRADSVDRINIINATRDTFAQELDKFANTEGLTSREDLLRFDENLRRMNEEALQSHNGSNDSRAILQSTLEDARSTTFRSALDRQIRESLAATDHAGRNMIGILAKEVRANPEMLPNAVVRLRDDLSTLGDSLTPQQEQALTEAGVQTLVTEAVQAPLLRGDFDGAERVLQDNKGALSLLSPDAERGIRHQIDAGRRQRQRLQEQFDVQASFFTFKENARRETIQRAFAAIGLGNNLSNAGLGGSVDPTAVVAPFDPASLPEGEGASGDSQDAARMLLASRALLLAGESGLAGGLLSQAKFIMENNPAIQRNRELDKPVSPELARDLGVPVGTRLRDVAGRIPTSNQELARQRARGAAEGKAEVENKEQIGFISQARGIINQILDTVKRDPTSVGIGGSFRATRQNITEVFQDVFGGTALIDSARQVAINSELTADEASGLFDFSNPQLSTLKAMENSIGLILARIRVPDGRVPVDVINRSIQDVKLTGATGSKVVQDRLNFVLQQLEARERTLSGKSGVPTFRVENGKLVPVTGGR